MPFRGGDMMLYHGIRPKNVVTVKETARVSERNRGMPTMSRPRDAPVLKKRPRGAIETSIDVPLLWRKRKAHVLGRTYQPWR